MSKRNQITVVTPESVALKNLRLKCDLSLRKLADHMQVSFSRVHQMESGRENISEDFIRKFLEATGYSWEDWNCEIGGRDGFYDLREKCHQILDSIEPSKLELIHGLLSNF